MIPDNLTTNNKLFANDTSLFATVHTMNTVDLNNDLNKIRNWAIQWKTNFNIEPSKQAHILKKVSRDKS